MEFNLSDPSGNEDTSSDDDESLINEVQVPRVPTKRPRSDTTTSHGSSSDSVRPNKVKHIYSERSEGTSRLSQSSLSENCSSPNNQFDDFRPGSDQQLPSFDNDTENGEASMHAGFQDSGDDTFYNNHRNQHNEPNDAFAAEYSEKSRRMMDKMGFKFGKGLGKNEHGRTQPVEASTQKGRRGLGLKPSTVGDIPRDFKWSPDESKPVAREEVVWMPPPPEDVVSGDVLEEWLCKGPKKLTIDDETDFVDPQILKGVLESKTIFDTLDDEDLRNARFRSNPYETIGSVIFLNRAAVKMANIDAVFDFMFTKPKRRNGESAVDKKELLYFADICAGPGGFSEYVLYRRGWRAKGFGFTLKGQNDFKLSDFYAGAPETFNPYYGVHDDGNIFNPENLKSLKDHVLRNTDDKGVHFLMADGGFSVEGQENIQEILSKQLYLCQCLAALMLVRTGGHFVVKLFDVFTLFSVGLIYIMYRSFDKVCIHKPVTSRPANSERYMICMWKKLGTESAERHLFDVNSILCNRLKEGKDVTELVPMSVIQEDIGFYEYIYKSNCLLGERQIKNLLKIAVFSKDRSLKETTQAEIREQCLKLWLLPDKVRTQPDRMTPDDTLLNILTLMKKPLPESQSAHGFKTTILNREPEYLSDPSNLKIFRCIYDWHFMVLSNDQSKPDIKSNPNLKFFIACGGKQLYQLDGSRWNNMVDLHVTMPAKTLIYAELVKEYRGQGNNQIYSKALHVIDAMILGGVDISHLSLTERINQCQLFCTALEKPFDSQAIPVRCKRLFNMELFPSAINNFEHRAMKRVRRAVTINTPNRNREEMFYEVGSLLFIREIRDPWMAQISKKSGQKYYFCTKNKQSEYHILPEAALDMVSAFTKRVMWRWDAASAILEGQPHEGLSRADMENFVTHKHSM